MIGSELPVIQEMQAGAHHVVAGGIMGESLFYVPKEQRLVKWAEKSEHCGCSQQSVT